MEFEIISMDEFKVMGKEYPLSDSLSKNIRLAQKHWSKFNRELKRNKVNLGRNWLKYAFVINKDNKFFYYIAVPKKTNVPDDFKVKSIPKSKYLKINHIGNMNKLKNTVDYVYDEVLPHNDFELKVDEFSYFEKYDYKFHWNRPDSVIEIYFPLE